MAPHTWLGRGGQGGYYGRQYDDDDKSTAKPLTRRGVVGARC